MKTSEELLQLLMDVDSHGTGLTRPEIAFVAGLIDGDVKEFTAQQARLILRLHRERVTGRRTHRSRRRL